MWPCFVLQYCVEFHYKIELVDFLKCYFQSEHYPMDLVKASEMCVLKLSDQNSLETITACAKSELTMINYGDAVLRAQKLRPLLVQTPHLFINQEYSNLAGIDLRKALCRVQVRGV